MATHWQVRRSPTLPGGLAHLGGLLPDVQRELNHTTSCCSSSTLRIRGGDHRLVRDPVHRPLPAGLFDFVAGVLRWHNPHCGLHSQSGHRPVPLFPTPNDRPASLGQRRRPLEQIIYRRSR